MSCMLRLRQVRKLLSVWAVSAIPPETASSEAGHSTYVLNAGYLGLLKEKANALIDEDAGYVIREEGEGTPVPDIVYPQAWGFLQELHPYVTNLNEGSLHDIDDAQDLAKAVFGLMKIVWRKPPEALEEEFLEELTFYIHSLLPDEDKKELVEMQETLIVQDVQM